MNEATDTTTRAGTISGMADVDSPDVQASEEFLDRDLGWLEFNRRVLHEALDERTPLLERLRFLGIFTSNLDEFFMKRLGLLRWRLTRTKDEAEAELLREKSLAVRDTVLPMLQEQARAFREEIRPALAEHGILLLAWSDLSDEEREEANRHFQQNIFPVLTPQLVDPGHPFPFISNLSDSLAIALKDPETGEKLFARLKVPHKFPQWVELKASAGGAERRFASLRELITQNLARVFPGMQIDDVLALRVTRSAYVEYEERESDDLLEAVEEELRRRRLQQVVRLEHGQDANRWLLQRVVEKLRLAPEHVYEAPGELDYTDFMPIADLDLPELRYPPWKPVTPPALAGKDADIFSLIRSGNLLVHHPYESFDATVGRFIRQAVNDDNVLAIKMTVYRTSDDSPFLPWLIRAVESGKQVACLVELKARFDEYRNIRWANALVDAGVHVVYGVLGFKTHTKAVLVVRREEDGVRCYAHIGTGNYNPDTARLYTDLGFFTCDPEFTDDVVELFHYLTGRSHKRDYNKLLVAPVNMKQRFLEMIERETEAQRSGRPAGIIAKMNQLEDPDVIRALYRASEAGVPIQLVIRGFCVLRPGLPNLSPTIQVISIIGRFLEHSRVFYFRNGVEDPLDGAFYLGSGDWMRRNLEQRVESVTPIEDRPLKQRLWTILQTCLEDQRQAWEMQPDGSYRQRRPPENGAAAAALGTHRSMMDTTCERNGVARQRGKRKVVEEV